MKRKKIQDCLQVKQVLELMEIGIQEDESLACPLHEEEGARMKWYKELNAVACMNPRCIHYQQVFPAMELLQAVQGGKKQEATTLAEELLIKELEEYRAAEREEEAAIAASKEPKEFVLSKQGREFLLDLKIYLSEKGEDVFKKQEVYKAIKINEGNLKYYLKRMQEPGYIRIVGGSRYNGFTYELVKLPDD